ncbi:hypothetical protein KA183_04495 [bacterium]|nr:hypothetical protein [bacterium]QQR59901.1 MAG: hypothetical protein IPG59_10585 [Candidatus Melainabacteria bacterium]
MTSSDKVKSTEQIFQDKLSRRREIAQLPVEEKYRMLIKLQSMVAAVDVQAGRERKRPWDEPYKALK